MKKLKRIPAILSDIDGVVYRGGSRIGGSDKVLRSVLNPLKDGTKIPFSLLTNGGGIPENERALYINKVVFGQNSK